MTNSDVERVYQNLLRGSRNHLRAFASQLEALGETYEAQFLSQEQFDAIADSPRETGNGKGRQGQRGSAKDRLRGGEDKTAPLRDRTTAEQTDRTQARSRDRAPLDNHTGASVPARLTDCVFADFGFRAIGSL